MRGNDPRGSMSSAWPREAIVYTETVVHTAPERYLADAPYQLAIVEAETGERWTVRVMSEPSGQRVRVGDKVEFVEDREGVAFFRPASL